MISITFKDVGQGDSILITWNEGDVLKIGIVDCHRYSGNNPLLDEVKQLNLEFEVEFILLSHGHRDHYSGILELLDYFKQQKKVVKNFISTLNPCQFQFFEVVLSYGEQRALTLLIDKLNELYSKDLIIEEMYPAYNKVIKFKLGKFDLECLYPRQSDYNILGQHLDKYIKGRSKTKPDLNYISTILKISNQNLYVLLTSDSVIESLDYIKRKDDDVKNNTVHLAQVPHHGSIKNHNTSFWKILKKHPDCPAVISVGSSHHNLPDEKVVSDLSQLGYKVYSTNYVNGIKTYIEGASQTDDYNYVLDCFSVLEDEYTIKGNDRFRGDKRFEIHLDQTSYVKTSD